jgi:addiction module HigA family antidote
MASEYTDFRPNYTDELPGDILRWFLEGRGIKIVDFAKRCGRPTKTISEIISGKTSITPETALQFERVLGAGAGMWLSLDAEYQLRKARQKEHSSEDKTVVLNWAKQFPIKEMIKLNFFPKSPPKGEIVDSILRAFGVSSKAAWENYWEERLSFSFFKQQQAARIDPYGVAVWLRRSEIVADSIETAPYDESGFRSFLVECKSLTVEPWSEISQTLIDKCASVGVAISLVPFVRNSGLRGAAYWSHKDKAVIVLSDWNKHEDNIWFAFFHEAFHILHHSKKTVFLDQDNQGTSEREIEDEADDFSAETLVPASTVAEIRSMYGDDVSHLPSGVIKKIAMNLGIAPSLLLVRLQHEGLISHRSKLNTKLRRHVEF